MIIKLYEFIKTDENKWITCPYPWKLITSYFRISAFAVLIILGHITVFTCFYYAWLGLVIVFLSIIQVIIGLTQNSLENIYFLCLRLSIFLCTFKKSCTNKLSKISDTYYPIFEPETALRILQGTDIFQVKNTYKINYDNYHCTFNFSKLFSTFLDIN